MKKILFAVLVLSTFFTKAQTSVYHPFPDTAAVWNIDYGITCLFPPSPGNIDAYFSITISGDTLIGGKTYHKLKIPATQYLTSSSTMSTMCFSNFTSAYNGAIRQDLLTKKVYYIEPNKNTDTLLYDFNLQVRDTVKGYLSGYQAKDTVQTIDSVLVKNTYRKRWNINSCGYMYSIIEGIGSTTGLLYKGSACVVDAGGYDLTCFIQNSQTLYPDTNTTCYLLTSIASIDKKDIQINLYPNPANNNIQLSVNNEQIKEIKITDILGKEAYNQLKPTPSSSKEGNSYTSKEGNIYTVDVSSLSKGIYFIHIKTFSSFYSQKFIVQH